MFKKFINIYIAESLQFKIRTLLIIITANTRSPEAPTAANINLHVHHAQPTPLCRPTEPAHGAARLYVSQPFLRMPVHLQHRQPGRLWA